MTRACKCSIRQSHELSISFHVVTVVASKILSLSTQINMGVLVLVTVVKKLNEVHIKFFVPLRNRNEVLEF